MARLDEVFDPSQEEGRTSFTPLPAGQYVAQIIASEFKDTKSGTGRYIKLEFEISEGQHQSRKFWENINIVNPNPQAVEIARKTLKEICESVGIFSRLEDTEDLHFKPMLVTMRLTPRKDSPGEFENRVGKYEPLQSDGAPRRVETSTAASGPRTAPAAAPARAAAGGPAKKPWEIKKT